MDSKYYFNKINNLRMAKGWSANYLCKQAGVSHNTLYTWQRRKTMPTLEVLEPLCDVLKISLSQLFAMEPLDDLTNQELELLEEWSTLTKKQKEVVSNMIKVLRAKP